MSNDKYVGFVEISDEVAAKIGSKHGLTVDDVRDAVQWPNRPLRAGWLNHPDDPRGPRLVLEGLTATRRRIRVVLYPVSGDPGLWRLGTARPTV